MKRLLNTLYVTTPGRYLSLDGENLVVLENTEERLRVPLHNLEGIVTYGYTGASPALMGACADRNISLSFMRPDGRFLARVTGPAYGNILLRRQQYALADDPDKSLAAARCFIVGKLYNARAVLNRAKRDHALRLDAEKLSAASDALRDGMLQASDAADKDTLRGIEGKSATRYFSVFDDLILQQKEAFVFDVRSRRPPLDPVNAMLSFVYALLGNMCAAALETVGLDPYAGMLHTDRPGRASLALDLMEELRPALADRFVLSLVNKRMVSPDGFVKNESGAVRMDDDTRRAILSAWQSKKQEELRHPYLDEKMSWGLLPHVQALLLARHIRGDLEQYPPFFWR